VLLAPLLIVSAPLEALQCSLPSRVQLNPSIWNCSVLLLLPTCVPLLAWLLAWVLAWLLLAICGLWAIVALLVICGLLLE